MKTPPDKGPVVKILQEQLLLLGLNPGPVDGEFGAGTRDAIKIFQVLRGLESTGVVNEAVWQELYRALGESGLEDVDPESEVSILVDRGTRTLTIMVGGRFHKQFRCAVGKPETPTPLGDWKIIHKSLNWGSGFGTRWMGLNVPWGIFGVHGTNKPYSIGSYASHGCIRMFNNSVEEVYPLTRVGTPVKIIDSRQPITDHVKLRRQLKHGTSGQDVVYLQWKLRAMGIPTTADGAYGNMTAWAVSYYQSSRGLPVTGTADQATYDRLNAEVIIVNESASQKQDVE
ncbi:MAG: L,D-transpeptidase family protein [Ignavibacteriales bacterium]